MKKKIKSLFFIGLTILLLLPIINANAALISCPKTANVTVGSLTGYVKVTDKATKNNITGDWSFDVSGVGSGLASIYRAEAIPGASTASNPNPTKTNNGNTVVHRVLAVVYVSSSGSYAGSASHSFTFKYNTSTQKVS